MVDNKFQSYWLFFNQKKMLLGELLTLSSSYIYLTKLIKSKEKTMGKLVNGPSTTGNPSGGGRGNNPPKGK